MLRLLTSPPKPGSYYGLDIPVVRVGIAEVRRDQINVAFWDNRPIDCPICGQTTRDKERVSASLYPEYSNGVVIGHLVWVHSPCFEACPETDEPDPVPW
ncbi:MAG: hypothetical protein DWQ29_14940 [Planctomycetota bacterium]|nr:MAG: hypothetical protein DWQ29_14940 [Planctomycetota bacterium]